MASNAYLEGFSATQSQSMENYQQGCRGDQGQLSPARRFFCLFVTFDFLFICLMWLICLVLSAHSLIITIENQVLKYTIHSSLFDVVMLAGSRFIPLLLMYGVIHISHWWAVALTTLGSSAFLVTKVFFYDWEHSEANSTFGVCMLLCSFVLAWGEVWLLDFRVIPRERQAIDIAARPVFDERTPLLRGYPQSVGGRSSYYSPIASPTGSDDEDNSSLDYLEKESYRRIAREAMTIAYNSLQSDEWQVETTRGEDVVYSRKTFNDKRIYKFVGLVAAAPKVVFEELYIKFENSPNWNPSLLACKILKRIDDTTDIAYQLAAEGGSGLVSSRDFVNLRTWEKRGDDYISAGISVNYAEMPPQKTYIRGENGPSAWLIEYISGELNFCRFHWLLHTELKGWLPQYLIDQTLASVMLDFVQHLRNHLCSSK